MSALSLKVPVVEMLSNAYDCMTGFCDPNLMLPGSASAYNEALEEGAEVTAKKLGQNSPSGLIGHDFEDWLAAKYGGTGEFQAGGKNFDGAFGDRWIQAKSGNYWTKLDEFKYHRFQSDMGAYKKIAADNGKILELHSNTPIPQYIKDWLTKKGIPFFEHLE